MALIAATASGSMAASVNERPSEVRHHGRTCGPPRAGWSCSALERVRQAERRDQLLEAGLVAEVAGQRVEQPGPRAVEQVHGRSRDTRPRAGTSSTLSAPTGPRSSDRPRGVEDPLARRIRDVGAGSSAHIDVCPWWASYFIGQSVRHNDTTECPMKRSRPCRPSTRAQSRSQARGPRPRRRSRPGRPRHGDRAWLVRASGRSSSSGTRRPRSSRGRRASAPARWRSSVDGGSTTTCVAAAGSVIPRQATVRSLRGWRSGRGRPRVPGRGRVPASEPDGRRGQPAGPPRAGPRRPLPLARPGRGPVLDRARLVPSGRGRRDRRRSRSR